MVDNCYTPDNWVMIEVKEIPHYRVLGIICHGPDIDNEWRLSSAIKECTLEDNYYIFKTESDTLFKCHRNDYDARGGILSAYEEISKSNAGSEMLEDKEDWTSVDWL